MKRYLIIFISQGEFYLELIMANNIVQALDKFEQECIGHEEIYSISLAR